MMGVRLVPCAHILCVGCAFAIALYIPPNQFRFSTYHICNAYLTQPARYFPPLP